MNLHDQVPRNDQARSDRRDPLLPRPGREFDALQLAGHRWPALDDHGRGLPISWEHDPVTEGVAAINVAVSAQTGWTRKDRERNRALSAPTRRRGVPKVASGHDR